MRTMKLGQLLNVFFILVLSTAAFSQSASGAKPNAQTPQDLLQSMVGEKLILLHFGDTEHRTVKKTELNSSKEHCDIAIQVKNAAWNNGKPQFVWDVLGTPMLPGKPRGGCKNIYVGGSLQITGFAPDVPTESLAASLRTVLQTPEQYLDAAGISFTLPPEPDLPEEVGVPQQPFTPAKLLFMVEATFSEQARKSKYQGNVAVVFYVGTDGRAHRPKITHPLGMGLDEQVLSVVSMWRFEPAHKLDKPVPARMAVETSFNLY
jgi:TonB family protein